MATADGVERPEGQFQALLDRLGMTLVQVVDLLGTTDRTIRNHVAGRQIVLKPVWLLLSLMCKDADLSDFSDLQVAQAFDNLTAEAERRYLIPWKSAGEDMVDWAVRLTEKIEAQSK
jgi:predicted transcriptional regulator